MTTSVRNIVPRKRAEAAATAQYTSSDGTTIIDKFTVTNVGAADDTFNCWLVPDGGTASNDNLIIDARPIAPGETYECPELIGQVILIDGFLSTEAGAVNTLVISGAGRVIET